MNDGPDGAADATAPFDALTRAIRNGLPASARVRGGPVAGPHPPLFPAEADHAQRLAPRRRAEFAAGRAFARDALGDLGRAPTALPVSPAGAPLWPPNVVGAITHSDGYCAAVAALPPIAGLGVDVAREEPLSDRVLELICTPAELAGFAGLDPGLAGIRLFCIKESVYKAYAPQTGSYLGFLDVHVLADPAAGRFGVVVVNPRRPRVAALHGTFGRCGAHIFALCVSC